jgi:hypothetical protein
MRALLLGLTLLAGCSAGSDMLGPSDPGLTPTLDPRSLDQPGPIIEQAVPYTGKVVWTTSR